MKKFKNDSPFHELFMLRFDKDFMKNDEITFVEADSSHNSSYDLESRNIFSEYREFQDQTFLLENSIALESSWLDTFIKESNSSIQEDEEQYILEVEKKVFLNKLVHTIKKEPFEFGINTSADILVESYSQTHNWMLVRDWMNTAFLKYFTDIEILLGLLRVVARLDYQNIYPTGQTMALAALSHENDEVKENGVRAFESWCLPESIELLESIEVSANWLREYIDEVISDIKEEFATNDSVD